MQQTIILIIWGIFWAIATFLLQKYGLSVVVASCVVGLIGAVLGHFLKLPHLSLIIFAGSFVWMTSTSIWSIPLILFAWAISGLIYKFSLNIFAWFWGRLWTIAFISTVISFYMAIVLKKLISLKMKK